MKKKYILLYFCWLFLGSAGIASNLSVGKQLFKSRCAACHGIVSEITGPALANITNKHNETWIINFVRNSQQMIKSGDEAAKAIFEAFNSLPMPPQKDLSDNDIRNILAYIQYETAQIALATPQPSAISALTPKPPLWDGKTSLLKVAVAVILLPSVLFGLFCYRRPEKIVK